MCRGITTAIALIVLALPAWGQRITKEQLLENYDLTDFKLDRKGLMAPGVAKDGIPALTDPERVGVAEASYPVDQGRVVVVQRGEQAVAYPLGILNWHEIVNDTVGDVPLAVTYCPLCDSVSVFDRRLGEATLEFGVSGLLYNSNVVMYERTTMGLWSQVMMKAVSGPHAGKTLTHLPFELSTMAEFRAQHPTGEVLTTNTGHRRAYTKNPYAGYFKSDRLFQRFEFDKRLPPKELGMGIAVSEGEALFVPARRLDDGPLQVETSKGAVTVQAGPAGLKVVGELPAGVSAVQTFYHSWGAFYPETRIVPEAASEKPKTRRF